MFNFSKLFFFMTVKVSAHSIHIIYYIVKVKIFFYIERLVVDSV